MVGRERFVRRQIRGLIAGSAAYTMSTALAGYGLAVAIGLLLAIVLASAPVLERGLFPFFVASQAVPIIAFSAVVILWLGNGPLSKVAIAFYLSFFPITVSVVKGLASCDPGSVALLQTFGARPAQILWKLRLPVMLPFLFVALRVATTTALIGATLKDGRLLLLGGLRDRGPEAVGVSGDGCRSCAPVVARRRERRD